MSASCMSHLCHGWILASILFSVGLLLFYAVAVCHLKWHCQVFLARACDWISKSSLAALLSLTVSSTHTRTHTHNHTLLNLDTEMTHSFHSLHRCLRLAFPTQAFGRGWAHSCFLLWRIALNLPTSFTIFPLLHPSLPVFLHFYLSPSNPHVSLTYREHCCIHYIILSSRPMVHVCDPVQ